MDNSISVSLPTDEDGFVSQECPACAKRFKVVFAEGSDKPISYCPYCEHAEQNCWWTQERADYLAALAGNRLAGPMLDDFARKINRSNRPGSSLQMTAKVKYAPLPPRPAEREDPMALAEFPCCEERIKHDGSQATLQCIICGKTTRLS